MRNVEIFPTLPRVTMVKILVLRARMFCVRKCQVICLRLSSSALGSRLLMVHHAFPAEPIEYLKMETFLSFFFLGFHLEQVEKPKAILLVEMGFWTS